MNRKSYSNIYRYVSVLTKKPQATALIFGSDEYPNIRGSVNFYQTKRGVIVAAEASGLPSNEETCKKQIFGFHIHGGAACSGNADDPFANALSHFDMQDCPHPFHSGDLPPLFGAEGYAFSAVLTDRFSVKDIIGKTVIIHSSLDDFTTQPGGASGKRIACGEIKANTPLRRYM